MPEEFFLDCDTQDIKRLSQQIGDLSVGLQLLQFEKTLDLDRRDQMIVIIASLEQLQEAAYRACRDVSTPRFLRSIREAIGVARKFGTGTLRN